MLSSLLQQYQADLDAFMRQVVNSQADQPSELGLMLRYALGWVDQYDQPYHQPTGKRIRPMLLLLCAESVGGNWRSALPGCCRCRTSAQFLTYP